MKFPDGERMICWYCSEEFKAPKEPKDIICPKCGNVLKVFKNTKSK